jgi:hypothetical protein
VEKKDLTGILDLPPADAAEVPLENPLEAGLDAAPTDLPDLGADPGVQNDTGLAPDFAAEPAADPASPTASEESSPLEQVRDYAERVAPGRPRVEAAFPFSLLIEGVLELDERERLIDLLARESMGIREIDLEPQLAAGRILIPRISEYAGVLIIQALRATRARMRLAPSDSLSDEEPLTDPRARTQSLTLSEEIPSAELIPISTEALESLDPARAVIVDIVTASAALRTTAVEAEKSQEYAELLESLARELKYKAYRKGAHGIVGFQVTLTPLTLTTHYRVTAMGSAVRAPSGI